MDSEGCGVSDKYNVSVGETEVRTEAVVTSFEFIRQLGNIFLVRPEILKSYITENYLGRIDSALLRPYLAQRSDWGQFAQGFDGPGELVPADGAGADGVNGNGGLNGGAGGLVATSEGTKGLRDRFGMGRLSMMMKDLEGLRLGNMGEGMQMHMPTGMGMNMPSLPSGFSISTRAFGRSDTPVS